MQQTADTAEEYERGDTGDTEVNEVVSADLEGGDAPMEEDSDGEDGRLDGIGEEDEQLHDTSIAAFYEHRNSIFCLALHPRFPLVPIAFSGGADDYGRLWDTRTGAHLAELKGHKDSVVTGGFSASGEYIATGGLDGAIRIWRVNVSQPFAPVELIGEPGSSMPPASAWGQCEFVVELEGPDEIVWADWHPKGNVLAAGASDATVWMWNIPNGNVMNCFSGHTAALTCGQFTPDGRKLVTTSEDGSLIVWHPRSATALSRLEPGNTRFNMAAGITSLALSADSKVAVVGGAAGGLRVVNISNIDDGGAALVVGALAGHEEGESIEAVAFIDILGNASGRSTQAVARVSTTTNVVSVATDGNAIVWDLSASKVRCEAHLDEPITDLVVHGAGPLFTTSSADGKLVTWDARTANHVAIHSGFTDAVLNVVAGIDDGYTQGSETGGVGAVADLEDSKGWKVIAAGDEGVALVFRC